MVAERAEVSTAALADDPSCPTASLRNMNENGISWVIALYKKLPRILPHRKPYRATTRAIMQIAPNRWISLVLSCVAAVIKAFTLGLESGEVMIWARTCNESGKGRFVMS